VAASHLAAKLAFGTYELGKDLSLRPVQSRCSKNKRIAAYHPEEMLTVEKQTA
jgi:hypothetical protein